MSFETGTVSSQSDWWTKLIAFLGTAGWTVNDTGQDGTLDYIMAQTSTGRAPVCVYTPTSYLTDPDTFYVTAASNKGYVANGDISGQTPPLSPECFLGYTNDSAQVTYPLRYWFIGTGTYLYCIVELGTNHFNILAIGEADRYTMTADVGQFSISSQPYYGDYDPNSGGGQTTASFFSAIGVVPTTPVQAGIWDGTIWRGKGWNTRSNSWISRKDGATQNMLCVEYDLYRTNIFAASNNSASIGVMFPLLLLGATNVISDPKTETWDYRFYGQMPGIQYTSMRGLEDGVQVNIGGDNWIGFRLNQGPIYEKVGYLIKVV